MEKLERFCDEPSKANFLALEEITQVVLNATAEYCLKKDIGNFERAKKIQLYYTASSMKENSLMGVRALFLAMKLLQSKEFVKAERLKPKILVRLTGFSETAFTISYDTKKLEGMFIVLQTNNLLGVDKELALYLDDAKLYFMNLFSQNPIEIDDISVKFHKKDRLSFYKKNIGVVWSNEECIKCLRLKKAGATLDKKCQKLLAENCGKKIRYRPVGGVKAKVPNAKPHTKPPQTKPPHKLSVFEDVLKNMKERKECPVCMTSNKMTEKKCIACGTKF